MHTHTLTPPLIFHTKLSLLSHTSRQLVSNWSLHNSLSNHLLPQSSISLAHPHSPFYSVNIITLNSSLFSLSMFPKFLPPIQFPKSTVTQAEIFYDYIGHLSPSGFSKLPQHTFLIALLLFFWRQGLLVVPWSQLRGKAGGSYSFTHCCHNSIVSFLFCLRYDAA